MVYHIVTHIGYGYKDLYKFVIFINLGYRYKDLYKSLIYY